MATTVGAYADTDIYVSVSTATHCPGLLLGTKAPVMTPIEVDFCFFSFFTASHWQCYHAIESLAACDKMQPYVKMGKI